MDENHPLDPNSPYGAGKAAADLLLLSYYKLYGLEISVIRPFNFYGERQNMEAYAAVVPVTIWRILKGEKPILEGDGSQSRDFTYVNDGADIAVKMMDCDKAVGRVVNIGQGQEIDIKTVISMICDKLDYPFDKVEHKPPRPSDVRRLYADITLAKKMLGYSPKTNFNEGLKLTIDWFRSKMECKNARS
jgi:UDP-glucose 4-epimerase